MEEAFNSQEDGPYNAREDFERVQRAIADVEGEAWLNGERRIADHWDDASEGEQFTSLEGARRWLVGVSPDTDAWRTVYGSLGVNRWHIHADGRVRFSRSHASKPGLVKAQEMGFWID